MGCASSKPAIPKGYTRAQWKQRQKMLENGQAAQLNDALGRGHAKNMARRNATRRQDYNRDYRDKNIASYSAGGVSTYTPFPTYGR